MSQTNILCTRIEDLDECDSAFHKANKTSVKEQAAKDTSTNRHLRSISPELDKKWHKCGGPQCNTPNIIMAAQDSPTMKEQHPCHKKTAD
eukprot:5763765-Ditylum_brightwellii.AAC.1